MATFPQGLAGLRAEHPKAEMIVVGTVKNSFYLDFAQVLTMIDYVRWLEKHL